jgi:hypothetical protein
MNPDDKQFDEVEKLLHLKRYEHPPEGFYEQFLDDFHDRQRLEIMQRSAWSLFWDRVETWFWSVGTRKRVYLVGAAYAAVMIGLFIRSGNGDLQANKGSESDGSTAVVYDIGSANGQGRDGSKLPALGDKQPSNESIVPAGIKSFLREF